MEATGQIFDLETLAARARGIEAWLKANAPECFDQQFHLDEGSQERTYWHYGYYAALSDALAYLVGELPAIEHGNPKQDTNS